MSQKWKVVLDLEIIPLVRGDGVFLVVMVTDAPTRRITQIDFKTFAQPERENVVFFWSQQIESTLSFNCCDKLLGQEKCDEHFQLYLYLHLGL